MSSTKARVSKADLTTTSLESLLRRLDSQPARAAEAYEAIRRKLIRFFQWNSCVLAEDLADEAFDRTAQRISENVEIEDVGGFVWGVAKKLLQEAQKKAGRTAPISDLLKMEVSVADRADVEQAMHERIEWARRVECYRCCLKNLAPADQKLFLSYHDSAGHQLRRRQELAASLGLTIGALRVKINRLRDNLEKCVNDCLTSRGTIRKKQARPAQNGPRNST